MNLDVDRKSGWERGKQTDINCREIAGSGKRTTHRQQESRDRTDLVDQYSPVLFGAIVAVLLVWAVNALLNYTY